MKQHIMAVLIALATLGVAACAPTVVAGSDASAPSAIAANSAVGVWRGTYTWGNDPPLEVIYEFRADGSFQAHDVDEPGIWRQTGAEVRMEYTTPPETTYVARIAGNVMSGTMQHPDGTTGTFRLVRDSM